MKKAILLRWSLFAVLALPVFILPSLRAQRVDKTSFGFKAGISGANLYDDAQASDIKGRVGFTGGGFVKIPLTKKGKIAIRPELLFTTKSANFSLTGIDSSFRHNLGYVELPVSLDLRFLGIFNIHGGVSASLLATSNGEIFAGGTTTGIDKGDFNNLDYGWHVGGGLDLGNVGLHLRVSRGLKAVSSFSELKNSAWALTFSLAI